MRRRFMISSKKVNINNFLTIVALEDGTTIELTLYNGKYGVYEPECSINGEDWFEYATQISLNQGDTLSLRASRNVVWSSPSISISKKFNAIGNANTFGNNCKELFRAQDIVDASLLKASGDCSYMFYGCTSLTSAPELPDTILKVECYKMMFYGCTSLTTAPVLPATTLATSCYNSMFENCSKLNYIKMLATDISAIGCLGNWVNGVSSTGIFVKNKNATWNVTGENGVPSGWTIQKV